MELGDQITRKFIKSVKCPIHGEFCSTVGGRGEHFCRPRKDKAIKLWHEKRLKERDQSQ